MADMDYSNCPKDVRDALDKYHDDVASGKIIPWNPNVRDEYCDVTADMDTWVEGHLKDRLPEMSVEPGQVDNLIQY